MKIDIKLCGNKNTIDEISNAIENSYPTVDNCTLRACEDCGVSDAFDDIYISNIDDSNITFEIPEDGYDKEVYEQVCQLITDLLCEEFMVEEIVLEAKEENHEIADNIYELAEYLYKDAGQQADYIADYDDVTNYYNYDVTQSEYNEARSIVENLLNKVKYYEGLIELSDNHTIFDINRDDLEPEVYYNVVQDALNELEAEIGTPVYAEGRSGRHICIEDTFENALKYDDFCKAQKTFEDQVITYFNNEKDLEESISTKTENVSNPINLDWGQYAFSYYDSSKGEGGLKVPKDISNCNIKDEIHINGNTYIKVGDNKWEYHSRQQYAVGPDRDDAKIQEMIDKLYNQIEAAGQKIPEYDEFGNEIKDLKESKTNCNDPYELFDKYADILSDVCPEYIWNDATQKERNNYCKKAARRFLKANPEVKSCAKQFLDVLEDNNYHTDYAILRPMLEIEESYELSNNENFIKENMASELQALGYTLQESQTTARKITDLYVENIKSKLSAGYWEDREAGKCFRCGDTIIDEEMYVIDGQQYCGVCAEQLYNNDNTSSLDEGIDNYSDKLSVSFFAKIFNKMRDLGWDGNEDTVDEYFDKVLNILQNKNIENER